MNDFPLYWFRFFDRERPNTAEAKLRNFIATAVHKALKGRRTQKLRMILRESPEETIHALVLARYRALFPQERIAQRLQRLHDEKILARRARDANGRRFDKTGYRVALNRIKNLEAKKQLYEDLHKQLRTRFRVPINQKQIIDALKGEIPESNVARLATLFVMGYWVWRLNEILTDRLGMTISDAVDRYYEQTVATHLSDENERIVVREGLRMIDGLLLPFGDYLHRFYQDCMFCSFAKGTQGSVDIENNLLYLFPGVQMKNWLSFTTADTVPNLLKVQIPKVFPISYEEGKISTRRIIGQATRTFVPYQPLAVAIFDVLKLKMKNNKAPHLQGIYFQPIIDKLEPYLDLIKPEDKLEI